MVRVAGECWHCGGPIGFSMKRKRKDGTIEKRRRPFPVHLAGPCQLWFKFAA